MIGMEFRRLFNDGLILFIEMNWKFIDRASVKSEGEEENEILFA